MTLETDLAASLGDGGLSLRSTDQAVRIGYGKLKVWDADGQIISARMTLNRAGLILRMDDRRARYPLTIDPTFVQEAYLKASNTDAGDEFGYSLAISGDTLVVGAPGEDSNATGVNGDQTNNSSSNSGAAYVFVRSNGSWNQEAYLKASNTGEGDEFGGSVAVSEDTVVVGAALDDSNSMGVNGDGSNNIAISSGAAYVFVRSVGSWSQQAYLKASNTGANDFFGFPVAIFGDTVVVGAPAEDSNATGINGNQANNSSSDSGATYIFERSGNSWSQQAYLKSSNTGSNDRFGKSVAIDGDTVVVAADWEDSIATGINGNQTNNSATAAGAAYVYVRTEEGLWSQEAYLKASNTGPGDQFGWSLALSDDTLVVGAPGESSNAMGVNGNQSDNSVHSAGAAYIFLRSGTTWTQQAYLKASNTDASDHFGRNVTISGDTAVVGAPFEDSNATGIDGDATNDSTGSSGAAYLYLRSEASWNQQAYLKASNTGPDEFGYATAISGDTMVVGAYRESSSARGINGNQSDDSENESGAVYVFIIPAVIPTINVTLTSPNAAATYHPGDSIELHWTTTGGSPGDSMVLSMKRDSASGLTEPDGLNWIHFTSNTPNDGSETVRIPASLAQANDWRFFVRHVASNVFDGGDQPFTYEVTDNLAAFFVANAFINGPSDPYDTARISIFINPGLTKWIAWNSVTKVETVNPSCSGYYGNPSGGLCIGTTTDDFIEMTVTNPLGQSQMVRMDENTGHGNSFGPQNIVFGTASNAPDAIRISPSFGTPPNTTTIFNEPGTHNSLFTVAGVYTFQFNWRDIFGAPPNGKNGNGHPITYLLQYSEQPDSPSVTLTSPNTTATYHSGDTIDLQWTTSNANPSDSMILAMKRDSASGLAEPDGLNWIRFTSNTPNDESEPVTIPSGLTEADDWRFYVRHAASDAYDASDEPFIYAILTDTEYRITATKTGTGTGNLSSNPIGGDCGPGCRIFHQGDLPITLTAAADPESVFTGWTGGGCEAFGLTPCVISALAGDLAISGNFDLAPLRTFTLNVTVQNGGNVDGVRLVDTGTNLPVLEFEVDPNGIKCAESGTCTKTYDANEQVYLKATPNEGYEFRGWNGCDFEVDGGFEDNSTFTACSIVMDSDKTITSNFELIPPAPVLWDWASPDNIELLNKFSPVLYLKNTYTPRSINKFVDFSTLVRVINNGRTFDQWDREISGVGSSLLFGYELPRITSSISPALFSTDIRFLDFQNSGVNGGDDEPYHGEEGAFGTISPFMVSEHFAEPAVYGNIHVDQNTGYKYLQYHLFYYINEWNGNGGPALGFGHYIGYHEGDWEYFVIELDEHDIPRRVAASIHVPGASPNCTSELGGLTLPWDSINSAGSHPEAFVGAGGHPTYLFPGVSTYNFYGIQQIAVSGTDFHNSTEIAYIVGNEKDRISLSYTIGNLVPYTIIPIDKVQMRNIYNWLASDVVWGRIESSWPFGWADDDSIEKVEPPVRSPLGRYNVGDDDGRWANPAKWMNEREITSCSLIDGANSDQDGIPETVELQTPNLYGYGNGDGNGDGVEDFSQHNVSSLRGYESREFITISNSYPTPNITFKYPMHNVIAAPPPADAPQTVHFPLGVFRFEIEVPVGGEVELRIYVPEHIGFNRYLKKDNTGRWINIAENIQTKGTKTEIVFHLKDGGVYDADGLANGIISDPGGPAIVDLTLDSDGDEMSDFFEYTYGLDINDSSDRDLDGDQDGLTNLQEAQNDTNPNDPDSDDDTFSDGDEIAAGTDPNDPNSFPTVDTFTISGSVSGLLGSGLVLQNNGDKNLAILANGAFAFASGLPDGTAYHVTIQSPPSNPNQSCAVSNGSGTLAASNVTNVTVTCTTTTYPIGGSVSGLSGSGLVLQNNAGDNLPIASDGVFTFPTALNDGSDYHVTVFTQPTSASQICTVGNASGTLAGTSVNNVMVNCVSNPPNSVSIGGSVSGLSGSGLVLQNNGGNNLAISGNGAFTFTTPLADGSNYHATILTQPSNPNQTCTITNGSGTLAGANVTNIAIACESIVLGLSLSNLNFGFVQTGTRATQTVTLSNAGSGATALGRASSVNVEAFASAEANSADLVISAITTPATPFAITGGTCSTPPITLAPAQSCTIEIAFNPTIPGHLYQSSVNILSNAASSPDTITLNGQSTLVVHPIPVLNRVGLAVLVALFALSAAFVRIRKAKARG